MLSSLVLLCLASLCSAQLSLDIYYESLCPDSTRFISKQLGPMYEALGSDVTVNFNPYGFAEVKPDSDPQYDGQPFPPDYGG